jgi:cation:H+ antiporter
MVLVDMLLFALGLALLVKGADYFVKAAAAIAEKLGVSEFVIGLTVVAVGTSIPELVSSAIAALVRESDLVLGNVVGSNIANIGLIVGLAAVVAVIVTRKEMLKRDGYIMLFAALIFAAFVINGVISRLEGALFLLLYVAYTAFLFEDRPKQEDGYFKEFLRYFLEFKYLKTLKTKVLHSMNNRKTMSAEEREQQHLVRADLTKEALILGVSGFAIVIGAKLLVDEAILFSEVFNIPKTVIGFTLVAVGTSLPELGVTFSAARQGYGNIAVGNVLGSNIVNIFLVAGVAALIFPLTVIRATILYSTPFMIAISIVLLIFIRTEWKITRREGAGFLIAYALFLALLFYTNQVA